MLDSRRLPLIVPILVALSPLPLLAKAQADSGPQAREMISNIAARGMLRQDDAEEMIDSLNKKTVNPEEAIALLEIFNAGHLSPDEIAEIADMTFHRLITNEDDKYLNWLLKNFKIDDVSIGRIKYINLKKKERWDTYLQSIVDSLPRRSEPSKLSDIKVHTMPQPKTEASQILTPKQRCSSVVRTWTDLKMNLARCGAVEFVTGDGYAEYKVEERKCERTARSGRVIGTWIESESTFMRCRRGP